MFTREQLLAAEQKTIRYISIVNNSACTGNALIEQLKDDFRSCQNGRNISTILVVDQLHIYNLAAEKNIPLADIEKNRDILDPLVEQAFNEWWEQNESGLIDFLRRNYAHKAYDFKITISSKNSASITERVEAFNQLLQKLGIRAEIVRWQQWLSLLNQGERDNIMETHAKQYEQNTKYREGFKNSAKEFVQRRLKSQKNKIIPSDLEQRLLESSEAYLIEAPLTLVPANLLKYRQLKYAGPELEAFAVTRQYLLGDPNAVSWVNTADNIANSSESQINSQQIISKLADYAKKFSSLKHDDIFIQILAFLVLHGITEIFLQNGDRQRFLKKLIAKLEALNSDALRLLIKPSHSADLHKHFCQFFDNSNASASNHFTRAISTEWQTTDQTSVNIQWPDMNSLNAKVSHAVCTTMAHREAQKIRKKAAKSSADINDYKLKEPTVNDKDLAKVSAKLLKGASCMQAIFANELSIANKDICAQTLANCLQGALKKIHYSIGKPGLKNLISLLVSNLKANVEQAQDQLMQHPRHNNAKLLLVNHRANSSAAVSTAKQTHNANAIIVLSSQLPRKNKPTTSSPFWQRKKLEANTEPECLVKPTIVEVNPVEYQLK